MGNCFLRDLSDAGSGGTIQRGKGNGMIVPIVSEMLAGAVRSCEELRESIINVKFAGFAPDYSCEQFTFEVVGGSFKPGKFIGELRGRNADFCLGHSEAADKTIAARVLIDGHAKRIEES